MTHRRALRNFMVIGITNQTNRDLVYGGKREKSVFKQQWAGHQLADSQHSGCKVLSHFREGLQKTSSPPPLGGQGPLPVLTVPLLSTFTNSIPTACCILYLPLESLAKARILSHSCSMHQLFPLVRADRASLPNSPWSDSRGWFEIGHRAFASQKSANATNHTALISSPRTGCWTFASTPLYIPLRGKHMSFIELYSLKEY